MADGRHDDRIDLRQPRGRLVRRPEQIAVRTVMVLAIGPGHGSQLDHSKSRFSAMVQSGVSGTTFVTVTRVSMQNSSLPEK